MSKAHNQLTRINVQEKISKRGRKLVDYDSSRHHLEALQTAKKRDDVKIRKVRKRRFHSSAARLVRLPSMSGSVQAEEEVNAAKSVYENINSELKEELPVLFDKWGHVPVITSPAQRLRLFNDSWWVFPPFSAVSDATFQYSHPCPTCKTPSSRRCTRYDLAAPELCWVLGSLITISLPLVHSRPPECDEGAAIAASRQSVSCERPAAVNIPLIWISSASPRIRHYLNCCLSFIFQFWLLEETFADVPQSLENQFFWVSLEL